MIDGQIYGMLKWLIMWRSGVLIDERTNERTNELRIFILNETIKLVD